MDILIDLCVEGADNLESEGWTENAAAVRLAIDEILRLRAHGAALAHVLSLLAPPPAPPHEPAACRPSGFVTKTGTGDFAEASET